MDVRRQKVIFLLILFANIINFSIENFIGPAQITLKRMEKCAEDARGMKLDFKLHKYNRTHTGIDCFFESPYEFGEGIEINLTVSKWGDGGWKPHILDMHEPNACEFYMKFGKDKFMDLLEMNNYPRKCPVDKGAFQIKDYVFDGEIDFPTMYGEFMIDYYLIRQGIQLICVKIFLKSDPKRDTALAG